MMEKKMSMTELPRDVRPQSRNVDNAQLPAEIADVVAAERRKYLLSLSQPNITHEAIPGMLKRVRMSVDEFCESMVTSWAYAGRYDCGMP